MNPQSFTRNTAESLLILNCAIDTHDLALALNTGASHTTIDLAAHYCGLRHCQCQTNYPN